MFKSGMRPVHPGEIVVEDYIKPMGVRVLAEELLYRAVRQPANAPGARRR